jgi:hypothetical protein
MSANNVSAVAAAWAANRDFLLLVVLMTQVQIAAVSFFHAPSSHENGGCQRSSQSGDAGEKYACAVADLKVSFPETVELVDTL